MRVIAIRIAPKMRPICQNRMSKVTLRSLLQRVCIKAGHASESTLSHLSCSRDRMCHDVQSMLYGAPLPLHFWFNLGFCFSCFWLSLSQALRFIYSSVLNSFLADGLSPGSAFYPLLTFTALRTVMVQSPASLTHTMGTAVCPLLHPKAGYIGGGFQWTWVWVHLCCPFQVFGSCSWQLLIINLSSQTGGNT